MKKLILVLIGFIFLFRFNLARAEVIINEIMYSPVSKQWIEIYNNTDSGVDITQYKIKDAGVVNGHNIIPAVSGGSTIIPAHAYGVIAKDITSVSATYFFHSALNIAPLGDTVILKNSDDTVDTVLVNSDSATDGNSLQLVNGSWISATPTPGEVNEANEIETPPSQTNDPSSNESSGSSNSSSTVTQIQPKIKIIENPTMKVKILANALAFTGQILEIKTNVSGFSNENVVLGRASWNFGDGGSFEQINNFEKFSHIYYYPGEYVLFLEYYKNSFSKIPEATSKMVIKVLPTSVFISKVGDAKDFFIELSNSASSDIDISSWVINASGKTFVFPRNSVIMSKKQMTISGRITGFTLGDQNNLKLYSGTGELIFDYNAGTQIPKPPRQNVIGGQALSRGPSAGISSSLDKGRSEGVALEKGQVIDTTSDVISNESGNNSSIPIIPIVSFAFIGTSAGAVYFIRRKKVIPKDGDDFEILDE